MSNPLFKPGLVQSDGLEKISEEERKHQEEISELMGRIPAGPSYQDMQESQRQDLIEKMRRAFESAR